MKSFSRILLFTFVLSLLMAFSMSLCSLSFATEPATGDDFNPGNLKDNIAAGNIGGAEVGINKIMGVIFRYASMAGSIIAIAILALFGIQWFTASVQKKAELKEKLWSYLIGALITFGAGQIMTWLSDMIFKVTGNGTTTTTPTVLQPPALFINFFIGG